MRFLAPVLALALAALAPAPAAASLPSAPAGYDASIIDQGGLTVRAYEIQTTAGDHRGWVVTTDENYTGSTWQADKHYWFWDNGTPFAGTFRLVVEEYVPTGLDPADAWRYEGSYFPSTIGTCTTSTATGTWLRVMKGTDVYGWLHHEGPNGTRWYIVNNVNTAPPSYPHSVFTDGTIYLRFEANAGSPASTVSNCSETSDALEYAP